MTPEWEYANAAGNAAGAGGVTAAGSSALSPAQAQMLAKALSGAGKNPLSAFVDAGPAPVSPDEGTTRWEDLLRWWYGQQRPSTPVGDTAMTVRG